MIAIVMVNWNGRADTVECLESLFRQKSNQFCVVIVDNGSVDGSIDAIKAWGDGSPPAKPDGPPWEHLGDTRTSSPRVFATDIEAPPVKLLEGMVVILKTGANLGFAGANNLGMEYARQTPEVSHFWLLNNDTVVAVDCMEKLVEESQRRPAAKIIGACLVYYYTPTEIQSLGGIFYPFRARGAQIGFRMRREDMPPVEQIIETMTYVMGASMFLSVKTYQEIGPMSEAYFLYFEEADWAKRLGRAHQQSVALDAVVYHKEGGSIGTSSTRRPSNTSIYYLSVNLLRFYKRWYALLLPIALARILLRYVVAIRQRDRCASIIYKMALFDFFSGTRRTGPISL